MQPLEFKLRIEMKSDWHIGSGQGRHRTIDRLIDRDHEGLPFVPSATARGIWRDAAQTLAYGMDHGVEDGLWTAFVDTLFGSEPALNPQCTTPPIPSRITLPDCRMTEDARAHFVGSEVGRKVLREALTFVKPGVSISRRSGRAKEDCLRFEEVARKGIVLEASGALDCPDEHRRVVVAFLVAAAALIERIGGKRRRGMGNCEVTAGFDQSFPENAAAAADILTGILNPPVLASVLPPAYEQRSFGAIAAEEWVKIPLKLTLVSPTIIAEDVQGNVVTCQDFIPSSYLLRHVAAALDTAGVADVWSLIASGEVRVLPATPEIGGKRGLPIPLRWETPKMEADGKAARLIPKVRIEDDTQHKPLREGFVSADASPVLHLQSVNKVLRTHNTVQDDSQRPDETVGGVYTYEALAAGQVFRSEVWLRGAAAQSVGDTKKLNAPLRLGRARQSGYGVVRVEALQSETVHGDATHVSSTLSIWLTSDAVLPGVGQGVGGIDALQNAIATALETTRDKLFSDEPGARWANLRWRRIEGWQSHWGLPRPTILALHAGSVAEFTLKDGVQVDAARLSREGLGELKGEGFGCVAVNHCYLAFAPAIEKVTRDENADEKNTPLPDMTDFVRTVYRQAWQRCIALRAEIAVSDDKAREKWLKWTAGSPKMSQLGALRSAMGMLTDTDVKNLSQWLEHLKTVENRASKWPGEALDQIRNLVTKLNIAWQMLGLHSEAISTRFEGAPTPAEAPGFDPWTDNELLRFARRTLLFEAMRAHKRHIEQPPKDAPCQKESA